MSVTGTVCTVLSLCAFVLLCLLEAFAVAYVSHILINVLCVQAGLTWLLYATWAGSLQRRRSMQSRIDLLPCAGTTHAACADHCDFCAD